MTQPPRVGGPPPDGPRGRLAGRAGLITGAASGIGAAGAQLFAAEGAALVLLAGRHQIIGDVRGLGLFAGVEFVADRASREPFPDKAELTGRVVRGARQRGVLILPGVAGANHGRGGDHIHLSPPYIVSRAQIDQVAEVLDGTLSEIEATL